METIYSIVLWINESVFKLFWLWVNDNFKEIITTLGFLLSCYYFIQKTGNNISIGYGIGSDRYSDLQISSIVISNRKDKTISIWSIDAVLDGRIQYNVHTPKAPIVLKAWESISITPTKYTSLDYNGEAINLNNFLGKIEFYVSLGNKNIKCKKVSRTYISFKKYPVATKFSMSFGEWIYNEKVRYILAYAIEGKKKCAFIDEFGFIGNEWEFAPNSLGKNYTSNDIQKMLKDYGYHQLFTNYICYSHTSTGQLEVVFRKQTEVTNPT
ncbi:hypothetical protein [Aeromonas veronii]|uniref:hypothetical protein n=1 Tax=Aeromonas veronii TaxID=654 RepID=UPI0024441FAC|nr:hypothetical protein [Aeromonas veronii]